MATVSARTGPGGVPVFVVSSGPGRATFDSPAAAVARAVDLVARTGAKLTLSADVCQYMGSWVTGGGCESGCPTWRHVGFQPTKE